jgi:hypothetical protein
VTSEGGAGPTATLTAAAGQVVLVRVGVTKGVPGDPVRVGEIVQVLVVVAVGVWVNVREIVGVGVGVVVGKVPVAVAVGVKVGRQVTTHEADALPVPHPVSETVLPRVAQELEGQ